MTRWLLVSGLATLVVASPVAADPEDDCANHVAAFAGRLPGPDSAEATTAAAARILLDLARPYRAALRECARKHRRFAASVQVLEVRWREAEAYIRELERAEADRGGEAELIRRIGQTTSDGELAAELAKLAPVQRTRRVQGAARTQHELLAKRRAEAMSSRATEVSVVKRLGMTDDDALDQAKVREAFQKLPVTDFIVFVAPSRLAYDPTGAGTIATVGSDDQVDYRLVEGVMRYEAHHLRQLPARTAGLIWSVDTAKSLIVVTIDGGRYRAPLDAIAFGVAPRDAAPAALVHDALSPDDIAKLAAAKLLPAGYASTIVRESAALARCMERQHRRTCGKHERAAYRAWVGAIAARVKDRKATLAVASARLSALTARAE